MDDDAPGDLPEPVIRLVTHLMEFDVAAGNDEAMNELGMLFSEGRRGFEKSYEKAVRVPEMRRRRSA